MATINKPKPNKVITVKCFFCGELLAKVFPWADITINGNPQNYVCKKCQYKKMLRTQ